MTNKHPKQNRTTLRPGEWAYGSDMSPKRAISGAPPAPPFSLDHDPPENSQGRLAWCVAKFGQEPHEWSAKRLRFWGYHDIEASRLVRPGERSSGWRPKWIDRTTRDRNRHYGHKRSPYNPTELFPNLWRTWGRCLPAPDDIDGRKRLGEMMGSYWRQFSRKCDAQVNGDENNEQYDEGSDADLFWCLHEALIAIGRKTWELEIFLDESERQWDGLNEQQEKAEERRAELKRQERKGAFGRPRSVQTDAVELIATTLNCSIPHAYKIHHGGTTVFEHRLKLAKAFEDDPRRNTPAKWEPAFGGSKVLDPLSFRAYLDSRTDQFEGTILSKTLDLLGRQAEKGYLPDQISDITELERASIVANADALLQVWKAYIAWRDAQQTRRLKRSRG